MLPQLKVLFLCTGNSCRSQMAEGFLRKGARTERECPKLFPGALNHHFWPFPGPAAVEGSLEEKLAAFRDVRDQIEPRVLEWLEEPGTGPVRGQR